MFFKCILSFTKLKKTIHCTLCPCSKLSPLLLFSLLKRWGRTILAYAVCSKRNAKHAPLFLQFGYSKSDIIKCKNKQLQLLLKRRKKNLRCAKCLSLKIGSKLTQSLFQSIYMSNTFFVTQPWQAAGLVISFNVEYTNF